MDTNLIIVFSLTVMLLIARMLDLRENSKLCIPKSNNDELETFLTDNMVNTKLTSNIDSIISNNDLPSDVNKHQSIEYEEGSKFGIDESGKSSMPLISSDQTDTMETSKMCLNQKGRDAVDYAYGEPKRKLGTNVEDVINLYDRMQGSVDLGMANVMSATSKLSKNSFTNRSRFNKRAFSKYFVEELNFHGNRYGGNWLENSEYDMYM